MTSIKKGLTWQDASDIEDLPNDQANAYNHHIRTVMAERAEEVVERWYRMYRKDVEENPGKVAAREYNRAGQIHRSRLLQKAKKAVTEKTCIKCQETKPVAKFYSGRNVCRVCFKRQQREITKRRQETN